MAADFRPRLQAWINGLWVAKDAQIDALLKQADQG
jgi:hypothetical protein